MEKSWKSSVVGLAAALVIAAVGYYVTTLPSGPAFKTNTAGPSKQQAETPAPKIGDTQNAALDQDLSAIDSQLASLNADSASIDKALNDQQIQQIQ